MMVVMSADNIIYSYGPADAIADGLLTMASTKLQEELDVLAASHSFTPGTVLFTASLCEEAEKRSVTLEDFAGPVIRRYVSLDWPPSKYPEDDAANRAALRDGDGRILVSYDLDGLTVWVITESDRALTTVMLPADY